jgi:8-oxo-dGTP diphosphatase
MSNSSVDGVRVAVGILHNDDRVLVCQRKKSTHYPLQWEFPGGKVESGESLVHCLQRELREELSIESEIGEMIFQHRWNYPDSGIFEVSYFFVRSFSNNIQNNVFEQIQWIRRKDLISLDMLEGNKVVIKLLESLP